MYKKGVGVCVCKEMREREIGRSGMMSQSSMSRNTGDHGSICTSMNM